MLLSDLATQRFCDPLLRFNNLLQQLVKSRKTLQLRLLIYCKGCLNRAGQQPGEETHRLRFMRALSTDRNELSPWGWSVPYLSMCMCPCYQPGSSLNLILGFYGGFIAQVGRMKSLLIGDHVNFQPLSSRAGGEGWNFQTSNPIEVPQIPELVPLVISNPILRLLGSPSHQSSH